MSSVDRAAAAVDSPLAQPGNGPGDAPIVRRKRRKVWTFDRITFILVFLGLPLAIYLIFVVSPFLQAIWYSLTSWSGFSPDQPFVGIDNYRRLLSDDIFMKAVSNNVFLAIFLPVVVIGLALALATLVTVGGASHGQTSGIKGAGFYRVVSFFPYAVPAIVVGIMWGQIFDPSNGIVNGLFTSLGFEQFRAFPWLGDARTAMGVMMFVMMWGFVGFYMILFVAAIKSIPAEIFEAARIDGAGRFRTAISITIPLIRDNVQTAWVYLGITAIDAYVYAMALNPGGGPQNATLTMAQKLFDTAFVRGQFGLACAMGVVMGVLTMAFAAIVFIVNNLTGGKDRVTLA